MIKEKKEVINFMDKDGSNTIDIYEFTDAFGAATDP